MANTSTVVDVNDDAHCIRILKEAIAKRTKSVACLFFYADFHKASKRGSKIDETFEALASSAKTVRLSRSKTNFVASVRDDNLTIA